jgi:hypothetical protein
VAKDFRTEPEDNFCGKRRSIMSNRDYGKLAIGILAVWFVFALAASAAHVFKAFGKTPPIALGLAAIVPVVVFWGWFRASAGFREFVLSLEPRALTIVQSWRFAGFAFVALYVYGVLPGIFANPAGWGDIFIGLTAPWVALKLAQPGHKTGFIVWNALGILDLVNAVAMGTASRVLNPGLTAGAMTVLPLSIVPTFLVPLFFILHMIAISQARRWPADEAATLKHPVSVSAI